MSARQIWITNFSKKDIMLEDLGIKVPSQCTIHLTGNYKVSLDLILKSIENGSIKKKSKYVKIKLKEPSSIVPLIKVSNKVMVRKEKSNFQFENQEYEELNLTDSEFATEFGDGEIEE